MNEGGSLVVRETGTVPMSICFHLFLNYSEVEHTYKDTHKQTHILALLSL